MINIKYQAKSRAKRERTERIQLLGAGFTLFLVMMDVSPDPSKTMTTLRIIAAVLGFAHLLCGLRYQKARALFGDNFEKIMATTAGLVLILSGIMLRMEGSQSAYIVQIIIGIFYIIGLPIMINKAKGKYGLQIDERGITFRKRFRKETAIRWKDIESVGFNNELLTVNKKDQSKTLKFYLVEEGIPLPEIQQTVNNYLTA